MLKMNLLIKKLNRQKRFFIHLQKTLQLKLEKELLELNMEIIFLFSLIIIEKLDKDGQILLSKTHVF